jgi:anti-sigma factor RsiW
VIRRLLERRRFMREHRWSGPRLSAYLDRELSEADRRRLEAHAGICPECDRMLATLRKTLAGLRSLSRDPAPPADLADSVIERLHSEARG